jgi:DnaK suppressor protein
MTELKKSELTQFKNRLEEDLASIRRLTEATQADRKPVELDQTTQGRLSRMDAMQVQEMALEQERRREVEVHKIEAALGRIKDGEFGYCVTCGEDIEKKRLNFDPATPRCLACAQG